MSDGNDRLGPQNTVAISVSITRWVDDEPQPGVVECTLVDRFGGHWRFVEKTVVVTDADLRSDSSYPQRGQIHGRVVSRGRDGNGREFAVVDTEKPWSVGAIDGATRFEVFADQLQKAGVRLTLSNAEALVLFEWLARSDNAGSLPIAHSSEQKILWKLEGQLEKQVPVFADDYQQRLDAARAEIDDAD